MALTRQQALRLLGVRNADDLGAIKRAYRARVKRFHPDVVAGRRRRRRREGGAAADDGRDAEDARTGESKQVRIEQVYEAYELLVGGRRARGAGARRGGRRGSSPAAGDDPFKHPHEPAEWTFVNELLCMGVRCPADSCCVVLAPSRFAFAADTGAARSTPAAGVADEDEEFAVYRAVNLCPRMCINYCTQDQHEILESTLARAITGAEDADAVGMRIEALVACGNYNNGRRDG